VNTVGSVIPRMKTSRPDKTGFKTPMQVAMNLHGHFGPFLALAVRMGLAAMEELGVKRSDMRLHANVMLEYIVPMSCVLDGIQTSTGCTVGNTRLTWKESKEIGTIFQLGFNQKRVEVWVRPSLVKELKKRLAKQPTDEEIRHIGWDIAFRSDKELFLSRTDS